MVFTTVFSAFNPAAASLLAYDGFDYPAGSTLTGKTGPLGFSSAYTAVASGTPVSAAGYAYGDLAVAGNKVDFAGTNGSGAFGILSNPSYTPGTTVYFSYLMRVTADTGYAGLSLFQGATETLFTGNVSGNGNFFGIDPKSGASVNSTVSGAKLSLLVYRIDFTATGATIKLYVNPTSGDEPATPNLTVTRTTPLTYDRIRLQSSSVTGSLDEFRLGTTFADVAPVTFGNNTQEVVVAGSSVAFGYGADTPPQSWAGRLGTLLETQAPLAPGSNVTWQYGNASVSGNNTAAVLSRYQNDVAVAHKDASIVIIGLSLANEGLVGSTTPQPVFDSFKNGMLQLIENVKAQGAYPMFTLCYPQNTYNAEQYEYIKRMNLLMNSWGYPSINLLGAIDDGSGHWAPGYSFDDGHPNSAGHGELFYSIVPTVFDAIVAGKKTTPQWKDTTAYLSLQQDAAETAPIRFTPERTMHSFTQTFRVRTTGTGTIAAVGFGTQRATLEVRSGSLVYVGPGGTELNSGVDVNDGAWHDIALAHRYTTNNTLLFVDGVPKGNLIEQLVPDLFVLGGPAGTGRPAAPAHADYQDLAIYRGAWTGAEALAQDSGALQQASMEICAPLADAAPSQGSTLENRAQSLSQLILSSSQFTAQEALVAPDSLKAESFAAGAVSLTWQGYGGNGFVVERRRTGVAEAWTTLATTTGQVTAYEDSGLTAATSYDYRISAVEGDLRSDSTSVVSILPNGVATRSYQDWIASYYAPLKTTYLVDFNPNASPDYGGAKWNTVTNPAVGAPKLLVDTTNSSAAGVTVAITDSFDQTRTDNGAPLTDYPAAAQSTQFALRDDVPLTGAIKFAGLSPGSTYDFTFFARRGTLVAGYDYSGTYTFTGAGAPVSVRVDGTLNTALTKVPGITPDASGNVTLTISSGNGTGNHFAVINFIQLDKAGQDPTYQAKVDPAGDPDGDGVSNFEEFARGLDPTKADASPFQVKDFSGAAAGSNVRLTFVENRRAGGVTYVLEKSADLVTWQADTTATNSLLNRAGDSDTVAFDSPVDGAHQFYRVRLAPAAN
ncbi:MAG: hypothetical protein JWO82_3274 [Akkermansiaceae bacterium]|nr:hypothetical protein [Akkermansiaceae bacterium]